MIYPIAGLCLAVALFVFASRMRRPDDMLKGLFYWPAIIVGAVSVVALAWFFTPALAVSLAAAFAILIVGLVKGWFY